ncbi:hypothetical protein ABLB69_04705 [Xenorhabdus khoisanae]|uniref:Uncharacterized protein n=1 Tax=Xenorhabdus khoisanae TaxID=880157 RepID=A0A0J5FNC7_9GAMM|nr:hypothetical protein [Xenorhabdus khoisanae]KMJ43594.1 hypothetical protein AB204_18835 [Xenorhabdus khoisanae]MDC9614437.1 hypothetical protein [Xenorhabdus khoisanae]
MNRKLAACILSLIIGVTATANANAFVCNFLAGYAKTACITLCNKIPDSGFWGNLAKGACL